MFLSMENAGILDVGVAYHVGALQALMPAIMQYALDELRAAWNAHYVHRTTSAQELGNVLKD